MSNRRSRRRLAGKLRGVRWQSHTSVANEKSLRAQIIRAHTCVSDSPRVAAFPTSPVGPPKCARSAWTIITRSKGMLEHTDHPAGIDRSQWRRTRVHEAVMKNFANVDGALTSDEKAGRIDIGYPVLPERVLSSAMREQA